MFLLYEIINISLLTSYFSRLKKNHLCKFPLSLQLPLHFIPTFLVELSGSAAHTHHLQLLSHSHVSLLQLGLFYPSPPALTSVSSPLRGEIPRSAFSPHLPWRISSVTLLLTPFSLAPSSLGARTTQSPCLHLPPWLCLQSLLSLFLLLLASRCWAAPGLSPWSSLPSIYTCCPDHASNLTGLNTTDTMSISKVTSTVQNFLLNSRCQHLATYLTITLGYVSQIQHVQN